MLMIKTMLTGIFFLCATTIFSQEYKPFKGYLYNAEYQVYLQINFYEKDVKPAGQELFGELPGYLGSKRDVRQWLITDAKVNKDRTADLSIINDYGSEDLMAKLVVENDSTYLLKQINGSTLKIVVDNKWVKLPKTLEMKRKSNKL
ncbi:hypothetical protein HMPREF9151_01759 [Hoylesella saccharolytica F0055]|uniref:Uncharacterized protein n=2 Tax=Hoylesella TaxID=2974257 RepID=L1N7J9_9BACT|nr:hypothetical protein HMPREF9151_01759 [Hoylesella saccharolytica F0055]